MKNLRQLFAEWMPLSRLRYCFENSPVVANSPELCAHRDRLRTIAFPETPEDVRRMVAELEPACAALSRSLGIVPGPLHKRINALFLSLELAKTDL